jgi:threonine synthase
VALVRELDAAVRRVSGRGFAVTPFAESRALSDALGMASPGGVWVKDETGNVSGSHKGRHLMGLAILGEVAARLRLSPSEDTARLAIASCGNAALAAAVVARAWGKPLDVFIPTDANANVVRDLERFGAAVHVCERAPGIAGDPCYLAFRRAVGAGAVPFCCQGPDNGLTLEGGETLGWEMIDELRARAPGRVLDRLFIQVGGGALASACIEAYRDVGVPLPRIHAVQTEGAFPLRRAWERLVARVAPRLGLDPTLPDAAIADRLRLPASEPVVREELAHAARHRAEFMWPWEAAPVSIAHGIVDDETYDWLAIVRGMAESGGFPVVVTEAQLVEANAVGRRCTGIPVDETGSAGLAGWMELQRRGSLGDGETVAVIFSGVRRS